MGKIHHKRPQENEVMMPHPVWMALMCVFILSTSMLHLGGVDPKFLRSVLMEGDVQIMVTYWFVCTVPVWGNCFMLSDELHSIGMQKTYIFYICCFTVMTASGTLSLITLDASELSPRIKSFISGWAVLGFVAFIVLFRVGPFVNYFPHRDVCYWVSCTSLRTICVQGLTGMMLVLWQHCVGYFRNRGLAVVRPWYFVEECGPLNGDAEYAHVILGS